MNARTNQQSEIMKHPAAEEWIRYIDGDVEPEARKRMLDHLNACAECKTQIGGWQRSIEKLKRFTIAQPSSPPSVSPYRGFQTARMCLWTAAAAIVLCAGFVLGRVSVLSSASMENRLMSQVRGQLQEELLTALKSESTAKPGFHSRFAVELRTALDSAAVQTLQRSGELTEIEKQLDQAQWQMIAAINELKAQQMADYISLRKDLETAVSAADTNLRENDIRLSELASTVLNAANP